ncbi:hypothetical protein B0J11DRAFT_584781 [Dendryphion nanum]|uniref:Uncharacterized protein n=1 Tax=Dendryphion nanum TaxID=256645 RepID=A0A9P9D859_9PLEO|nr:hypothetical protein B0J11DRAFT_584781 [Dendryphion nanum]
MPDLVLNEIFWGSMDDHFTNGTNGTKGTNGTAGTVPLRSDNPNSDEKDKAVDINASTSSLSTDTAMIEAFDAELVDEMIALFYKWANRRRSEPPKVAIEQCTLDIAEAADGNALVKLPELEGKALECYNRAYSQCLRLISMMPEGHSLGIHMVKEVVPGTDTTRPYESITAVLYRALPNFDGRLSSIEGCSFKVGYRDPEIPRNPIQGYKFEVVYRDPGISRNSLTAVRRLLSGMQDMVPREAREEVLFRANFAVFHQELCEIYNSPMKELFLNKMVQRRVEQHHQGFSGARKDVGEK